MFSTLLMSKLLTSIVSRVIHPENMYDMSFTFRVSKWLTSISVRKWQLNMPDMSSTLLVSKLLKSSFLKPRVFHEL